MTINTNASGAVTATGTGLTKWDNSVNTETNLDGKFTLEATVGTTVKVTAYFGTDSNGDTIDDARQIFVKYVAGSNGTLNGGKLEEVFTAANAGDKIAVDTSFTGPLSATPNAGYVLYDYTTNTNLTSKDGYFDFGELEAKGQTIWITANFAEDNLGGGADGMSSDGIADKDQIFVKYVSEDDTKGTVDGTKFEKFAAVGQVVTGGSTATGINGYTFDNWTCDKANGTSSDGKFHVYGVNGGEWVTITAHFTNAAFTITYTGEGMVAGQKLGVNNGDSVSVVLDTDCRINGTLYGSTLPDNDITVTGDGTLNNPTREHYVFNGWKVTDNGSGKYTFEAIWLADTNDDGIADNTQIFIKYATADATMGTVTTADYDVVLPANGRVVTNAASYTANPGFVLDYWQESFGNTKTTDANGVFTLTGLTGGETVTITAYFKAAQFNIEYKGVGIVDANLGVNNGDTVSLELDGGTLATAFYGVTSGSYIPVTGNQKLGNPTKDKAVFNGWVVTPNGSDYTFTAQWLTDEFGGGTDGMSSDGIADETQVFVKYVAGPNGTVTGKTFEKFALVASAQILTNGSTAEGNTGYILANWTCDKTNYTAVDDQAGKFRVFDLTGGEWVTITANFKAADYVIKYNGKDTNNDGKGEPKELQVSDGDWALVMLDGGSLSPKFYGKDAETALQVDRSETLADATKTLFVFNGWELKGTGTDLDPYTFTAQWLDDKNGDGIADKYQVFVEYVSADDTKGTVTAPATQEVYTAAQDASGVYADDVTFSTKGTTATAKTGYAFENWTNDYNSNTSKDGKFSFSDVTVGKTVKVIANWAVDANNDGYPDNHQLIVNYVVDDAAIAEITGKTQEAFNAAQKDDGTYEDTVYVKTTGSTARGKTASASMKYWKNSVNSERNQTGIFDLGRRSVTTPTITITAVFSKDSFGPDTNNDNKPDPNGVPDDFEVQIQLVDGLYGTISGQRFYAVSAKDDKGNYNEHVEAKFKLDPNVKVTPNKGYVFKGWKADVNPDKLYPANTTEFNFGTQLVGKLISIEPVFAQNHVAYVSGYPDGRFRPEKNITRAETATMIFRLFMQGEDSPISTNWNMFSDVDVSKWYNTEVSTMARAGYITGYPDGTFGGDKPITRAEFVTILVRFFNTRNTYVYFRDVSTNHWAYRYIATAAFNGWIVGYPDGTFKPDQPITRAEAVTVLNRLLGRGINSKSEIGDYKNFVDNTNPNMWYYYEIIEAANDHDAQGSRPNENWI